MPGPLLTATALDVRFGPLHAVRSVNLQLCAGDLLGLIGPNGAGKTTLLRVLAGLQPPTGGTIDVLGQRVGPSGRDHLRRIGFTPDTPAAYDTMTVQDFLRYVALGYNIHPSHVNERIDFWLEKVWLLEKRQQKVRALSRGMRQRLGIARTLLADPVIVLLDEPAAGLDPGGRVQFRELLCNLRTQGKAILVSSHILSDMEEYCTHIGIMSQGQIVRAGTVHEVAAHGDDGRCRIDITLAGELDGAGDFLKAYEGIHLLSTAGSTLCVEFSSDKTASAALLAALITKGFPVAAFTPNSGGLERAYLRQGVAQVD